MVQEYRLTANTLEGERRTLASALVSALACALVCASVFAGFLAMPWRILWIFLVVPPLAAFGVVVRRCLRRYRGVFTLRLDGRHLTVIGADRTVNDLGEIMRVDCSREGRRSRLFIDGSKDSAILCTSDSEELLRVVEALEEALTR